MGQIPDVAAELLVERLVETEAGAQPRDIAGIRSSGFAGEHVDRIARREVDNREVDDGRADADEQRLCQPSRHESPERWTGRHPAIAPGGSTPAHGSGF